MVFVDYIKWLLPTLTLLTQVGISLFFLHVLFFRRGYLYKLYRNNKDKLLWMGFVVALTATLGSLFYSEIVGWTPCKLCWLERIFMYPLTIILGIAAWRKDEKVGIYVLPMAAIGALISLIHYPQQIMTNFNFTSCAAEGGTSCGFKYSLSYGYVTIPMMALTAFIIVGILVYLKLRQK
jgi:disulfide bond formation protein DsbB